MVTTFVEIQLWEFESFCYASWVYTCNVKWKIRHPFLTTLQNSMQTIKKKFSTIRKEKNKEHPDGSLRLTMAPAPEIQRSFENISMRLAPFATKKKP